MSPTPSSLNKITKIATEFPEAPDRDLFQLAVELADAGPGEIPRVVNLESRSLIEGREDTFWLIDLPALEVYQRQFQLRLVTPHAYWYVEEGQSIRQGDIQRAADTYEERIYPAVTSTFGKEWSPGVDNDPHLHVLNARLPGLAGYYSSADEYPLAVLPFSNQREVIYINSDAVPMGSSGYLEVLAHELQHATQWNADPSEETWFNEGLAELAVTIAGFSQDSIYPYLRSPPTSLVNWPRSPMGSGASYGAASLFMHYLVEHYGDVKDLRPLLREPADGIAGVNAYLQAAGYDATFRDVFRDWVVANLLDEAEGVYSYSDLNVRARVTADIDQPTRMDSQIPQYAVEYVELSSFDGPLRIRFSAPAVTGLLPTTVDSRGCWWSNSGDSINSTLSRAVNLTGVSQATLEYQVWYSTEESWDYAYLEVSVDGGKTWDILETPHTTPENPVGHSFGMGYTGDSLGWIDESVDLTRYAGQEILIRFQYITDDATNGAGLCVRGIILPEAGLGDSPDGWRAQGFVLTDNRVRQDFVVQVIEVAEENRVTVMQLDETNSGELVVSAPESLDRLVVAVAAFAPKTLEEATYTLSVETAS